jgi:hypothetical protein
MELDGSLQNAFHLFCGKLPALLRLEEEVDVAGFHVLAPGCAAEEDDDIGLVGILENRDDFRRAETLEEIQPFVEAIGFLGERRLVGRIERRVVLLDDAFLQELLDMLPYGRGGEACLAGELAEMEIPRRPVGEDAEEAPGGIIL